MSLRATVLVLMLAHCVAQEEGLCDSSSDPACSSSGEALSLLQKKAQKMMTAGQSQSLHGTGLVNHRSELIDAIEANTSSGSCPCTWNAAYPCSLHGSCYSLSTQQSCASHGGQFCGSSSGPPACSCTWNAAYQCSLKGSCWGYDSKQSCEGAGGQFCGTSGSSPTPSPPPPTPPTPPSGSGGSVSGWEKAVLDETNRYRAMHHAPALTWDSGLAAQGQSWAGKCDFKHSSMGNGENLYAGTGGFNGASAVTSWYDEIKDYNFNYPGFSGSTGHFTQLVWKSTTKVGCGLKECSYLHSAGFRNAYFLVCEYSPAGNYAGEFPANVLQ